MLILISAGEASGEMYGAQLIEALRRAYAHVGTAAIGCPAEQSSPAPALSLTSDLTFFGAGGDRMRNAGCDTVIDSKDLAVVGITEILSHLPKSSVSTRTSSGSRRRKPDLAIVIDSPAFNWRVAGR